MKKAALIILFFCAGFCFAQAPELKGICFHSWEKLTELNYEDYKESVGFRDDLDDGYHTFTKDCKFRLYSEKAGDFEILRLFYSPNLEKVLTCVYKNKALTEDEFGDLCNDYAGQLLFVKKGDLIKPFARCRFGYVNLDYPEIQFEDYYFRQRDDGRLLVYEINVRKKIEINTKSNFHGLKYIESEIEEHELALYLMPEKFEDIYFIDELVDDLSDITNMRFKDFLFDEKIPLRYSLLSAFDGKGETSWCISKEQYKKSNECLGFNIYNLYQQNFNPQLEKSVHEISCSKMAVINGYAENMEMYKKNNRISKYYGGAERVIFKDDCLNYQVFNLYYFTFIGSFESEYNGSKYSDVCLAEINLYSDKLGWLFGSIGKIDHVFNNEMLDLK